MPKRQPEYSDTPAPSYSDLEAAQALITQLDPFGDDPRSPFPSVKSSNSAAYEGYISARVAIDHMVDTFDPVKREIAIAERSLHNHDQSSRRGFLQGILPAHSPEKPDHLTSSNAELLVRVLRGARSDPQFSEEMRQGIANALPVLMDLQSNLLTLESTRKMLSDQQTEVALHRRAIRRRIFLIGGLTLGGLALVGGASELIYDLAFSPEARRQQQLDELQYERTHMLTTDSSDVTTNGWTVRLAPEQEGITYSRSQRSQDTFTLNSGDGIDLGTNDLFDAWSSKVTGISIVSYNTGEQPRFPPIKTQLAE